MTHYGRDFSSYQGELTEEDCAGIDFAYVKATEGDSYKNPYAPQQTAMLQKCGVKVGYYHFLDMGVQMGDQLHNFNVYVSALGGSTLPPALDSETPDASGWQDLASQMIEFLQGVEGWTYPVPNPKSLIYVNLTFYENLPQFPWGRWVWLADPSDTAPAKPCLVWQQGPKPAPSGKVIDFNVFMGSDADWAAFTGAAEHFTPVPNILGRNESLFTLSSDNNPTIYGCDGREKWHLSPPQAAVCRAANVPNVHLAHDGDDGYTVVQEP